MRDFYLDAKHWGSVSLVRVEGLDIDNAWMVSGVEVAPRHRRKGHASQLLRQTCDDADREGATLVLVVTPDGSRGPGEDVLARWYASFGFEPWASETDDPYTMIRKSKEWVEDEVQGRVAN